LFTAVQVNAAGYNVFSMPRNYESIHITVVEICGTIERDVYCTSKVTVQ
jgi:hypothetical protein